MSYSRNIIRQLVRCNNPITSTTSTIPTFTQRSLFTPLSLSLNNNHQQQQQQKRTLYQRRGPPPASFTKPQIESSVLSLLKNFSTVPKDAYNLDGNLAKDYFLDHQDVFGLHLDLMDVFDFHVDQNERHVNFENGRQAVEYVTNLLEKQGRLKQEVVY